MYSDFAEIYNKLVFDIDYDFYYNTINVELDKNSIVPKNILEIGIGTGNLTKRMNFETDSYIGIDLSQEMLEIASNNLIEKKDITLLNADISDFSLNNFFDLAISTLDTINYILEEDRLFSAFKNIYNSLKKDSAFIFDINSENKLKKVLGNNTFVFEYENIFYTWQNFLDEEENIVDFVLDFFIEENGLYRRIREEQSEKIYSVDYIMKLLKKAGFKNISYKDFDSGNKVTENSQRILFTAIK
ncbi:class I SAM-dependent DNA methyltransferase [Miniphocaeibacter halophilus]|uniref:Class I SAM-dependent methyltransferase n=1 Tax=Miniphocaeibacter halophilus TaxID=2931922 RepID=A0AC61MR43_9FIRM|nr:class I SAM-dependent methyltransferase [Miniphocaeibacter halophilus]QQK07798.1 class I SAM-dependent methyltransferase [Miniphocaeibacter halophilus]